MTEPPEERMNRIRQFGYLRFCAVYSAIFPLCHLLASVVRAESTGSSTPLESLLMELVLWSAGGAGIATVFWLVVTLQHRLRAEKAVSRRN
jgi:hypothetical protein